MKSKLILPILAFFLIISPVLAQNSPKVAEEPKNNTTAAFELILFASECQSGLKLLASILRTSADVNEVLKVDETVHRSVIKKLEKEALRIEKELPAYRNVVFSAEIMMDDFWRKNESDVYTYMITRLMQSARTASQQKQFVLFTKSMFDNSEKCVAKFDINKKKIKLLLQDTPN